MIKNSKTNHSAWQKYLSFFCMLALVISALVGCNSYDYSSDIDALRSELTEEIAALKEENLASKSTIDSLTADYESAKSEISSLRADIASAEQKTDTLRANYEAVLQKINALKDSIDFDSQDIDSIKNGYDEAMAAFEAFSTAYAELIDELDTLKADHAEAEEEIEALRAAYDEAMLEIEDLRAELEELDAIVNPRKIRIYIDQGHNPSGHHNAGASGNGLYEQDVTFSMGVMLKEVLEADGRFEVSLSRPTATTVLGTDQPSSLEARVAGAAAFETDFFISLHINSFDTDAPTGIEVHVAEENSESYVFGNTLREALIASTGLNDRGMWLSPNLYVLKHTTMPAALLEMGFISNPSDAALLSESPEIFITGIYNGILTYFDLPTVS